MSYQTYTTEALVVGTKNVNTSDRSYLLFTKDAGMIWATARSVREERSKQRYALQDFSYIRVSLVKGKSGWRIGSVESTISFYSQAPTRQARAGVTSIVQLIRRLVHGEDPHPRTFLDTVAALTYICETDCEVPLVVDWYTLRTLAHLGYIAPDSSYGDLLNQEDWLKDLSPLPATAEMAIKQGLEVSHL